MPGLTDDQLVQQYGNLTLAEFLESQLVQEVRRIFQSISAVQRHIFHMISLSCLWYPSLSLTNSRYLQLFPRTYHLPLFHCTRTEGQDPRPRAAAHGGMPRWWPQGRPAHQGYGRVSELSVWQHSTAKLTTQHFAQPRAMSQGHAL